MYTPSVPTSGTGVRECGRGRGGGLLVGRVSRCVHRSLVPPLCVRWLSGSSLSGGVLIVAVFFYILHVNVLLTLIFQILLVLENNFLIHLSLWEIIMYIFISISFYLNFYMYYLISFSFFFLFLCSFLFSICLLIYCILWEPRLSLLLILFFLATICF